VLFLCVLNAKAYLGSVTASSRLLDVCRIGDMIEDLMERELFKLEVSQHRTFLSAPRFAGVYPCSRYRHGIHYRYDFATSRTRHARVTRPSLMCNVYHKAQISDVASW
jgi:hypothetical protein